jgi:hypothetical protein
MPNLALLYAGDRTVMQDFIASMREYRLRFERGNGLCLTWDDYLCHLWKYNLVLFLFHDNDDTYAVYADTDKHDEYVLFKTRACGQTCGVRVFAT